MPAATDKCPLCGKRPAEHPSIASSGYANFGSFDDFDDPGLQLGDGAIDAPPDAVGSVMSGGPDDIFGSMDADAPAPSGLFEIDAAPIARPLQSVTSVAPAGQASAGTGSGRPGLPSGAPAAAAPPVDSYEVAVLADFGPVPDQIYLTPMYAWRVFVRKRQLRRRHAVAVQAAAQAERARDDRLAALAERARPRIQDLPDFATLLQPLTDAERTAQDRSTALEQRSTEFAGQAGAVDRQIAEVQEKSKAAQSVVDAARRQLAAHEDVLKRVQALYKRIDIELRNTQELARAAAGPNAKTAPPEFASRLVDLQRELETRRHDTEAPQAAVDQALAEVKEAERVLSTLERTARGFRTERDKLEQSFKREAGMRSEGVQRAESERRAALIGIGVRLVESQGAIIDPADRDAWQSAQALVTARAIDAEKLLRAQDSDDHAAVKRGMLLLGLAAAIVVGLIVAVIVMLGSSQPV